MSGTNLSGHDGGTHWGICSHSVNKGLRVGVVVVVEVVGLAVVVVVPALSTVIELPESAFDPL